VTPCLWWTSRGRSSVLGRGDGWLHRWRRRGEGWCCGGLRPGSSSDGLGTTKGTTSSGSWPARTRSSCSVRRVAAVRLDNHGGEARSAPVDTEAKLPLFPVPQRGMRLLVVNSPAGEGELRRQLASALAKLQRRHDTEPRQQQWCGRYCLAGVGAWHRLPERKVIGWQRSGSGCFRRKQASREKETQWRSDEAGRGSAANGDGRCRGRGRLGRRGVPCLGAQARHAVGCSSGADRGMGAAGVGGVRALPYQGKRADAGVVEGEKGEGGRGCWVGPATEREGTNRQVGLVEKIEIQN
jgi:hypothetical protein